MKCNRPDNVQWLFLQAMSAKAMAGTVSTAETIGNSRTVLANGGMTKLSRRYWLSDRGLAKTYECMGVPVPGRGYWAKVL